MEINSLVGLLRERAAGSPAKTAFTFLKDGTFHEEKITFAELDLKARAAASALSRNYRKGERIILLFPPGLDFICGYFGCLYAGMMAVPVYPPDPSRLHKSLTRFKSIVKDSEAAVVLTNDKISGLAFFISLISPEIKNLDWISINKIEAANSGYWQGPDINGDTVAFIQYTSGSTSTPKGVMVTQNNLLYNTGCIAKAGNFSENSVMVSWLPNYHDMGLIGGIILPVTGGFTSVIMPTLMFLRHPELWLKAIDKYRGTASAFPNFALDLCVRKIPDEKIRGIDLSCWQVACNGAEPVKKSSMENFTEKFGRYGFKKSAFLPAYGLAEATLMVTDSGFEKEPFYINVSKASLERNLAEAVPTESEEAISLVSSGKTLTGQTLKIVNPETRTVCEDMEVGEIWLSGPGVAAGYWKKEKDTEEYFRARLSGEKQPFLRTGDLGFLYGGQLFVTGRLKDLIIIRGLNHYPQDIEYSIDKLCEFFPAVRPGCCAAFSTEISGQEKLVLFVEIDKKRHKTSNTELSYSASEIIDKIIIAIAEEHELHVHSIVLLKPGTIPKTSSGKIMRHACKDIYINGRWLSSQVIKNHTCEKIKVPEAAPEELKQWIINWLLKETAVEPEEIDENKTFEAYGLDSLNLAQFTRSLEEKTGRKLNPRTLIRYNTIGKLCKLIIDDG